MAARTVATIVDTIVAQAATNVVVAPRIELATQPATLQLSASRPTPNVTLAPTQVTGSFAEGTPLAMISAPPAGEPSEGVTLAQARTMVAGKGDAASPGGKDVRVPVSRNSLAEMVNGGVKLPGGVDQLLFVVKAAP